MPEALTDAPAVWAPPDGVRVRGTIALLAGAGESARVYERFAGRIAVDGYVVGVFEGAEREAAAEWLSARPDSPRVLAGSDAGAAAALELAVASPGAVDAVLLAAVPTGPADHLVQPEERTSCPVHLGVLADDSSRSRAATVEAVVPDAAALRTIRVPVLAVHGAADVVAPLSAARDILGALPDVELVETVDGLHDALNDRSHRSVAAAVVLWLERLGAGDVRQPIVRIGTL